MKDVGSPVYGAVCNQEQSSPQRSHSAPWHHAGRAAGPAVAHCLERWGRGAPSPQREVGERSEAGRRSPSDPKAFTE